MTMIDFEDSPYSLSSNRAACQKGGEKWVMMLGEIISIPELFLVNYGSGLLT